MSNKTVGNTCKIIMGQAPPSNSYNENGNGAVFVKVGEFDEQYPKKIIWTTNPKKMAQKGDVLLGVVGSVGEVNLSIDCAIGRSVASLRPNHTQLKTEYLYYFLQKNKHEISRMGRGTTHNVITIKDISSIPIPIPSLETQKYVIDIIQKFQQVSRNRQRSFQLRDNFTRALFHNMFGDPIKNSKNWKKFELSFLCRKITDGTHHSPPNSIDFKRNGIPYITAKNIKPWGIDTSKLTYVQKEVHTKIYERCNVEKNDILYVKDGVNTGIAAINLLNYPFSMLSSVALFKPKLDQLNPYYLTNLLNNTSIFKKIKTSMTGAAIKRVVLKQLRELEIPVPPIQLQNQFGKIMESIEITKQNQTSMYYFLNEKSKDLFEYCFKVR